MAPYSKLPPRRVVQTIPGPQTGPGPGDVLIDDRGSRWLVVPDDYNSGTPPSTSVVRTYENGWIK